MKKIGLLSDTHGFWDDKFIKYFSTCDEIWHAGDIGSLELYNKLSEIKPIKAVFGNIDGQNIRKSNQKVLEFTCENVNVIMTHIGGYPGKYAPEIKSIIYQKKPQLFICGHSHILKAMFDHQLKMLCLNPGAAGLFGMQKVRTIMRFEIEGSKIQNLEVIELSPLQNI